MSAVVPRSAGIVRVPSALVLLGVVVATVLLSAPAAGSGPGDTVIRVEEDWVLVLNQPDGDVVAPQFHTVTSPMGGLDSLFAQVTWNYRELPEFASGGLQLQGWKGEEAAVVRSFGSRKLSTVAETVTWTQALEIDGSQIAFTIGNGQSVTWGSFGYPAQNMHIQGGTRLADLNAYDAAISVDNSGITYGSNRVSRLMITEVRRYGPSGLLSRDTTDRVVFSAE